MKVILLVQSAMDLALFNIIREDIIQENEGIIEEKD